MQHLGYWNFIEARENGSTSHGQGFLYYGADAQMSVTLLKVNRVSKQAIFWTSYIGSYEILKEGLIIHRPKIGISPSGIAEKKRGISFPQPRQLKLTAQSGENITEILFSRALPT